MAYKILNGYVILDPNLLPKFRNYGPTRQCNSANVGYRNQLVEPTSRLKVTEKERGFGNIGIIGPKTYATNP